MDDNMEIISEKYFANQSTKYSADPPNRQISQSIASINDDSFHRSDCLNRSNERSHEMVSRRRNHSSKDWYRSHQSNSPFLIADGDHLSPYRSWEKEQERLSHHHPTPTSRENITTEHLFSPADSYPPRESLPVSAIASHDKNKYSIKEEGINYYQPIAQQTAASNNACLDEEKIESISLFGSEKKAKVKNESISTAHLVAEEFSLKKESVLMAMDKIDHQIALVQEQIDRIKLSHFDFNSVYKDSLMLLERNKDKLYPLRAEIFTFIYPNQSQENPPPLYHSPNEFFKLANFPVNQLITPIVRRIANDKRQQAHLRGEINKEYLRKRKEWTSKIEQIEKQTAKEFELRAQIINSAIREDFIQAQSAFYGYGIGYSRRRGPIGDVVRSEEEMNLVLRDLMEQEKHALGSRWMQTLAVIPEMLISSFPIHTNNHIQFIDSNKVINAKKIKEDLRMGFEDAFSWSINEKKIFVEKYSSYPKMFGKIASFLPEKSASDCVKFYYCNKKSLQLKKYLRFPLPTLFEEDSERLNENSYYSSDQNLQNSLPSSTTNSNSSYNRRGRRRKDEISSGMDQELSDDSTNSRIIDYSEKEKEDLLPEYYGINNQYLNCHSDFDNDGEKENSAGSRHHSLHQHLDITDQILTETPLSSVKLISGWSSKQKKQLLEGIHLFSKNFDLISNYLNHSKSAKECKEFYHMYKKEQLKKKHISNNTENTHPHTIQTDDSTANTGKKQSHFSHYWTKEEKRLFHLCYQRLGKNWTAISSRIKTKSANQTKKYYKKNKNLFSPTASPIMTSPVGKKESPTIQSTVAHQLHQVEVKVEANQQEKSGTNSNQANNLKRKKASTKKPLIKKIKKPLAKPPQHSYSHSDSNQQFPEEYIDIVEEPPTKFSLVQRLKQPHATTSLVDDTALQPPPKDPSYSNDLITDLLWLPSQSIVASTLNGNIHSWNGEHLENYHSLHSGNTKTSITSNAIISLHQFTSDPIKFLSCSLAGKINFYQVVESVNINNTSKDNEQEKNQPTVQTSKTLIRQISSPIEDLLPIELMVTAVQGELFAHVSPSSTGKISIKRIAIEDREASTSPIKLTEHSTIVTNIDRHKSIECISFIPPSSQPERSNLSANNQFNELKVIAGDSSGICRLFDGETGRELNVFNGHSLGIRSIDVSKGGGNGSCGGALLLTGGKDGTCCLFDVRSGNVINSFSHSTNNSSNRCDIWVTKVKLNPSNNNFFASCSIDGLIKYWDVRTNSMLHSWDFQSISSDDAAPFLPPQFDFNRATTAAGREKSGERICCSSGRLEEIGENKQGNDVSLSIYRIPNQ